MTAPGDPTRATIGELSALLRAGRLSPVELLDALTDRIRREDGRLAAFVHLSETARAAAERAHAEIAAGDWKGPLHGIPIAIKDNHTTADMPTRAGSAAPGTDYPLADAHAVARLRSAGAIPFAKTRMHEFAWGMETPPTRNPRDPSCSPGGSSGGSAAAVAAGLAPAALGSDTGGSIRIPASLCGCVGFKPSFGLIGRSGIVPHSWSLDHAGPIAASVGDAALVAGAMAGPDPADPGSLGVAAPDWSEALAGGAGGLRVGVCRTHFFEDLVPAVGDRVEAAIAALARAGARVTEFALPEIGQGLGAIFAIELASSTNYHDRRLREGAVAGFGADVRLLVEMGRLVSGADYLQAERFRRHLAERLAPVFDAVDVIVGPTMPLTAWRSGETEIRIGGRAESIVAVSWRLTYPWNLLGLPAISLPCGIDGAGLPVGLQIAGPVLGEAQVLRAAAAAERALGGPMQRVAAPA
ncbi:amidase [Paralimibaculum aggregatum]|uniref:Amidase n=1 Tax=Paralimibaculum aggregatum TaxID=3036245 RepID=A0ABQ6LH62_9RHOB|nr:amidase [Limibaculum sp. NKW23]GMG82638.1 amidase [Limibaculum sp. NKW23]